MSAGGENDTHPRVMFEMPSSTNSFDPFGVPATFRLLITSVALGSQLCPGACAVVTPAASDERNITSPPPSGSSVTCLFPTTFEMLAVLDSTSAASARHIHAIAHAAQLQ